MFSEVFANIRATKKARQHWAAQAAAILDRAAEKIAAHRANPAAFAGNGKRFGSLATKEDWLALWSLTDEEADALLCWTKKDWGSAYEEAEKTKFGRAELADAENEYCSRQRAGRGQ